MSGVRAAARCASADGSGFHFPGTPTDDVMWFALSATRLRHNPCSAQMAHEGARLFERVTLWAFGHRLCCCSGRVPVRIEACSALITGPWARQAACQSGADSNRLCLTTRFAGQPPHRDYEALPRGNPPSAKFGLYLPFAPSWSSASSAVGRLARSSSQRSGSARCWRVLPSKGPDFWLRR